MISGQHTQADDKALMAKPASKGLGSISRPGIRSRWKGMLWCEWFAQSKLLLGFVAIWLMGVWILPFFANPGWILLIGGIYALVAAPAFGGSDTVEGCEEFTFSLPATRSERYWARFSLGAGTLLIFSLLDMAVLGLDLPQILGQVSRDAAWIANRPVADPRLLYGLVITLPFAIFCFAFMISANTHSKTLILMSGFWGALIALLILRCGLVYEKWNWETWNGRLSYPLLVLSGLTAAGLGNRLYQLKEIGQSVRPLIIPNHWWLWILIFLVAVGIVFFLGASLIQEYSRILN